MYATSIGELFAVADAGKLFGGILSAHVAGGVLLRVKIPSSAHMRELARGM